ncbi:hypothetical protein EU537_02300 [Candidatus Thorarchaeota archaeon]|nr:MAG: hypothetical protein EU537_02300 [Candidatus Thorarchaeota archaeon]
MKMSDNSDANRNRAMQVAALNQKIESLQAQLGGAQRRANEAGNRVAELERLIGDKDSEIQMLQNELSRTKETLESIGKEMRAMKVEKNQTVPQNESRSTSHISQDEFDFYKAKTSALRKDLRKLSQAATGVIQNQENAMKQLEEILEEVGDPKYRVLNYVLKTRSVKKTDLSSMFLLESAEVNEILDELGTEGEIEMEDSNTVIPGEKYRKANIPLEEWRASQPEYIFNSLEEVVMKLHGPEAISDALGKAVDILEQKLARGGAIIFQMRRAANDWEKGGKNAEDLQYQIREWKSRALSLS